MTFPRARLVGLNSVTIRTPNHALMAFNLRPDGFNRLELMNVRGLTFHVVNIQRGVVGVITAINAPGFRFEVSKPLLDHFAVLVSREIHTFPVARLLKSILTPLASLFSSGLRALWSGATGAQRGAVFGAISLGSKHLGANNANPLSSRRIFPGRHNSMIPAMNVPYPCKPGIFEATYEAI